MSWSKLLKNFLQIQAGRIKIWHSLGQPAPIIRNTLGCLNLFSMQIHIQAVLGIVSRILTTQSRPYPEQPVCVEFCICTVTSLYT